MAFGKKAKLDAAGLKEYAARLLAGRALTAAELRRKLTPRAEDPEGVGALIETLRGYGVVDDKRLASGFAGNRAESGLMGRGKVFAKLRARGVAGSVAEKAVTEAYAGRDETKMVEEYLARKFRGKNLGEMLQDPAKLAGLYRRLRTAGFGSQASIGVLKRYAREAEMLEDLPEES